MSLLGRSISVGEEKRKPFLRKFLRILGAVVKLPDKGSAVVEVSNKPSRLTQIQEQVEDTYGRCTQLACQLLHKFGGEGANVKVTAELIHVTAEALSVLMESKPRLVRAWSECHPLLLFADGAVEEGQNGVTHGAILVDPWKQCSFYFGDTIPDEFVTMVCDNLRTILSSLSVFFLRVVCWGPYRAACLLRPALVAKIQQDLITTTSIVRLRRIGSA